MNDLREQLKIKRYRCPYCHDEIVPGGENQACRECLAWHHSECWATHGQCVGCGTTDRVSLVVNSEKLCLRHTPEKFSEEVKQDLLDLWGKLDCSCDHLTGSNTFVKLIGASNTVLKEHKEIRRAAAGPKALPRCMHDIAIADMRCRYCHKSELEIYDEACGTVTLIGTAMQIAADFHDENVMRRTSVWGSPKERLFWLCMIGPPLITALYRFIYG